MANNNTHPFWHSLLPEGRPLHLPNDLSLFLSSSPLIHTVVIGCGVTGLSALYTLTANGPKSELFVGLEMRGIGDGATGRNGGHQFMEVAGGEGEGEGDIEAKIEAKDVEAVRMLVAEFEKRGESFDLEVTGGVNLSFQAKEEPFMKHFVSSSLPPSQFPTPLQYLSEAELKEKKIIGERSEGVCGGVLYPHAAQICPGLFLLSLLKRVQEAGGRVFTGVCVTSIQEDKNSLSSSDRTWIIQTECGLQMRAKHVIHATNGYGLRLLPERYQEYMKSVRGQCIAAKAPVNTFPSSLVFQVDEESCEEYLIQRKDGVVVFGGFRHLSMNRGFDDKDEIVEEAVSSALESFLHKLHPDVNFEVTHQWSGIMCFTKDKHPLVGRIREREGQYIASGYSGHGMVRAFSCGRHVAEKILNVSLSCPEIDDVFNPDRIYTE